MSQGGVRFCPGDGSHFVPGRGPILSWTPSRRKCLCLMVFFLARFYSRESFARNFNRFKHYSRELCLSPEAYDANRFARICSLFLREIFNRGVAKPGGFLLFFRERSRLCCGPFWVCFPYQVLLRGREGEKEQIGKIPGQIGKLPEKMGKPHKSEVSKRGWRTEEVGARKSFISQRFRPLFCTLFPMPP